MADTGAEHPLEGLAVGSNHQAWWVEPIGVDGRNPAPSWDIFETLVNNGEKLPTSTGEAEFWTINCIMTLIQS